MKTWKLVLLVSLPLVGFVPVISTADQNDLRLDELFQTLKTSQDATALGQWTNEIVLINASPDRKHLMIQTWSGPASPNSLEPDYHFVQGQRQPRDSKMLDFQIHRLIATATTLSEYLEKNRFRLSERDQQTQQATLDTMREKIARLIRLRQRLIDDAGAG